MDNFGEPDMKGMEWEFPMYKNQVEMNQMMQGYKIQDQHAKWEGIFKKNKMEEAMEREVQTVFEKCYIFEGYDPRGYLDCYLIEMKL